MSRVKQIRVEQGDSLRGIALREYGDPTRWVELARLNGLRLPFIVESHRPADRLLNTAIWGDTILIPWESNGARAATPLSMFGADVALARGRLGVTDDGDIALVAGTDNIVQALSHRVRTLRGELVYHSRYGCHVTLALGLPTMPFASLMAAAWVHEALVEETRIASVRAVDARATGDILHVAASVDMVGDNTPVDLNLVLNP